MAININQLVRTHQELGLIMGWKDARSGPNIYSYRRFLQDINTIWPHCVRNVQQVREVMVGRIPIPLHWEKPVNELLELAVAGMRYPPSPGPFWHPLSIKKDTRQRAAFILDRWMNRYHIPNQQLGDVAEITAKRIAELRRGTTAMGPTELDRIAAAFEVDRPAFLRGPTEAASRQRPL